MNTYTQHKLKCFDCGLHFIVCSDHEGWPNSGSTAKGLIYCPECGSTGNKMIWSETIEGYIFQAVPGKAQLIRFTQ